MSEERFDYEVDDATRFVDNLKDRVHDLYDKNEELKEANERLNKGYCKFKEQCGKYATCLRENQIKEIERLNNKEEQLIRRLEDLIIVGEQVENEWAVDICKMIIEELKGSDKE